MPVDAPRLDVRLRAGARRRVGPGLRAAAAVVFGAAIVAGDVSAATKLEGEYQLMVDVRKEDRAFEWDFESNNPDTWTGAQFRLFSAPRAGVEAFVKFEADWNPGSNQEDRAMFQYRESHARFRWDRPLYGADIYLFQRQDRFWVENHLLRVIQTGNLTDFGNAQGVRADLWGLGGTNLTLIASDFSGQSNPGAGAEPGEPVGTDDAYVMRLRRELFDNRFRVGMTYNRKVEAQSAEDAYYEVVAGDVRYNVWGTDILFEMADSYAEGVQDHREGGFHLGEFSLERLDRWLPNDVAIRAEVRSIRLGTPSLGYYNVTPSMWYFGPNFVNPLGEATRDEQGLFINTWYLLPERAVTWTFNYTNWERFVFDQRKFTELYAEMYTEYVNGFTSKLSFSDRKTRQFQPVGPPEISSNRDLFAEVQVESRLAWMRVQGKIKDIGEVTRKELVSLETSINLTDNLKVYSRYAFGNDPARLRKGLFTQLQYRPRGNMDIFLEYGPNYIGDSPNPVDDGDLAGSGDNKDLIKLIVKGNF